MTIHDFDMARYILGEEPDSRVRHRLAICRARADGKLGDYDTVTVMMTTAAGKQAIILNSREAAYGYDQRVEAFGSKGMAVSENRRPHHMPLSGRFSDRPRRSQLLHRALSGGVRRRNRRVRRIGETGQPPVVGFEDGRSALVLPRRRYGRFPKGAREGGGGWLRRAIEGQTGDLTPKERVDGGVDRLKSASFGVRSDQPADSNCAKACPGTQGLVQANANVAGIFRLPDEMGARAQRVAPGRQAGVRDRRRREPRQRQIPSLRAIFTRQRRKTIARRGALRSKGLDPLGERGTPSRIGSAENARS